MKHIRNFESYKNRMRRDDIIKESVLQVNDIYKVRTMIDIPQSLINAYVKKVKDTTGKNLRQYFGDVDIAEEIVKYITSTQLDNEKIPGNAILGGQIQSQSQAQVQPQSQVQTQSQAQTQTQEEDDFEDVQAQSQSQAQEESQEKSQEESQEKSQEEPQEESQEEVQELPGE